MPTPTKTIPSDTSSGVDPLVAHALTVTQYARDIVDGTIPACKWTILACQRHLDDLAASEDSSYPYRFDHKLAGRICFFIECLPHVDGEWGSPTIVLEPWQKFFLGSVYGWVRKTDGLRRFTTVYLKVPRKNAKSTLAAGMGLYGNTMDGEKGAQVYCAATTLRQAMYVFGPAQVMAENTPTLFNRLGLEVNAQSLIVRATNSRFVPICSKPGDGGGASTFICDEFHEHADNILAEAITRGMGARRQPLTVYTTTAGDNIGGPCFELEQQLQKMLDGVISRERTFALMYGIDEGDDWSTIESAKKANPNWGVSVIEDTYLTELEEALQDASKQNVFKTKRLNVWCNAANGFFNMQRWNACADTALKPEQFEGGECVMGLDLASKLDLCATAKVFRREIEGEEHWYTFVHTWLPEAQVDKPENAHYQGWSKRGFLTSTEGNVTDYPTILADILSDTEHFKVRELAFDQREATMLTQVLQDKAGDVELAEIPQNVSTISEPLKWLQQLVESGRLHHDGNPVLTWAISNVVCKADHNENVYPRKAKNELKIDPVTALLNALVRVRTVLKEDANNFVCAVW